MAATDAALRVLGEDGWRLLVDAGIALDASADGDVLAAAAKLAVQRPDAPPGDRAAALELVTEGHRLARKMGVDARLLAVRGAVEQASSARVATWHAQQIPAGCRLLEIGCGCGADSLALAHRAANLIATDVDPVRAACTHMNLMTFGLGAARAIPGDGFDVLTAEGARADAIFVDPDRRAGGRRARDPELWAPRLSEVTALVGQGRPVFVKAASYVDADDVDDRFAVTYVSHDGVCLEAFLAATGNGEATAGPRVRAVLLPDDGPSLELAGDHGPAPAHDLGDALYTVDPAAMRAGLLAELCSRHGLGLLSEGIAFLTGSGGVSSPWLAEYTIRESLAMHVKRLRDVLRTRSPSQIRVRCHGVPISAPEIERDLRRSVRRGRGPALDVFVTRVAEMPTAVVAERV